MRRIILTGFMIWLLATVALRFWGQYLFHSGSTRSIAILLACSVPLMIVLPRWIFRHRTPETRAVAAIALVAPGMLLDTFTTIWFPVVFPNISAGAAALFGGWLLLCNVTVLISAAFDGPPHHGN